MKCIHGVRQGESNIWPTSAVRLPDPSFYLMNWPSKTLWRQLFFLLILCVITTPPPPPQFLYLCLSCCREVKRRKMSCNPKTKGPWRSHLKTLLQKPHNTKYCFMSNSVKICKSCSQHTCEAGVRKHNLRESGDTSYTEMSFILSKSNKYKATVGSGLENCCSLFLI